MARRGGPRRIGHFQTRVPRDGPSDHPGGLPARFPHITRTLPDGLDGGLDRIPGLVSRFGFYQPLRGPDWAGRIYSCRRTVRGGRVHLCRCPRLVGSSARHHLQRSVAVARAAHRLLTIAAVFAGLRFQRARKEIGPWVLACGLLLLHLEWPIVSSRLPADSGLMCDLVLGLGMLLVVFDEAQLHTRRLAALNALTVGISRTSQNDATGTSALLTLMHVMGADAAWFRTSNGGRLTVFQQVALSADFLRDRGSVACDDVAERIPEGTRPKILSGSRFDDSALPLFRRERQL